MGRAYTSRRRPENRDVPALQVTEAPGGGCCIEHMLAVKPVVPIPPAVAAVTSSIFVQQATDVMRDLCAEIARRQEAAVVVEMAVL